MLKDKIIEVSLQEFLKYGIKKMTVQKLVEPLGLSTKTVYKYFTDKEDLLKNCLLVHYAELSQKFVALKQSFPNPVIGIYKMWHEAIKLDFGVSHVFYYDLNYYYPQLQDAVIEKVFTENMISMKNLIEEGIQKGYFRDDISVEIITETMGILYTNITRTSKFKALNLSPNIILQNTLEVYLRGLCTEKGLIEINSNQLI